VSWKIISFALVGTCNTAVDFAAFTFAYEILTLSLVASNVMAWFVAVTFSYVLNTLTTFHHETGRVFRRQDYLNFVASGVLGVIATTTTLVVFSSYLHVMVAKLASILVGFIVNFTMSNFFVFRRRV
jgi:putative flippase GtrA